MGLRPSRGVGARSSTTAVVSATHETYEQKVGRWLDVMGFLTRWHCRRAWILDLDPPQRAATVMITEYERKLLLWLTWVNFLFMPFSLWYWYGQFTHLSTKPPIPLMPEYQYMNNRKRDFGGMALVCTIARSVVGSSSSAKRCASTNCARRAETFGDCAGLVRRHSALIEFVVLMDARMVFFSERASDQGIGHCGIGALV